MQCYDARVIASFGDRATEDLYHGRRSARVRRFASEVQTAAIRKLDMLHAAQELIDLRSPPGNRLKALEGELDGYHSIRVNDQWRIVFLWAADGAQKVTMVDYH